MYALIDKTSHEACTEIVLCPSCAPSHEVQREAGEIAGLNLGPDASLRTHEWGNCDGDVPTDRPCDNCGMTQRQATRAMMDDVAARLDRKTRDRSFAQSWDGQRTCTFGIPSPR